MSQFIGYCTGFIAFIPAYSKNTGYPTAWITFIRPCREKESSARNYFRYGDIIFFSLNPALYREVQQNADCNLWSV